MTKRTEQYYQGQLEMLLHMAESSLMKQCRSWLSAPNHPLEIYIRVTDRYDIQTKERYSVIDIANVNVEERARRKGLFKEVLQIIEKFAQENHRSVYIEQILVDWFYQWLKDKQGYVPVHNEDLALVKHFPRETDGSR